MGKWIKVEVTSSLRDSGGGGGGCRGERCSPRRRTRVKARIAAAILCAQLPLSPLQLLPHQVGGDAHTQRRRNRGRAHQQSAGS